MTVTVTDVKSQTVNEGTTLHLLPSEIHVHPTIEFLEKNGIFPINNADIEKMLESISNLNYLQPIVITIEDGKYYRIIGRRRLAVAERLGTTVPCYVRYFSSDDEIIEAWKSENFVRAHYSVVQQLQVSEKIAKIWSKRTIARANKVAKCSPSLQSLVEKGVFQMRTDEDLIKSLSELPQDIQDCIAETIKNNVVTKVEYKEEIKEVVQDELLKEQIKEKDEKINKLSNDLIKLQNAIHRYEERIKELEDVAYQKDTDNERIEQLQRINEQNKRILQEQIKEKEKEINQLKIEKFKIAEEVSEKIKDILSKQTNLLNQLITRLKTETLSTLKSIEEEISTIEESLDVKGHLLVICDILGKTKTDVVSAIDRVDSKIREKLMRIEGATTL